MAITTWAATTGDWEDSKFDQGWDGPARSPAVGSLSLSSTVPKVSQAIKISVGNASLEVIQSYEWDQMGAADWNDTTYSWDTGPSPNVNIGTNIAPAKGDVTLTGSSAPKVGIEYGFPISEGDLTVTGSIPAIKEALNFAPAVGNIEIIQSYEWNQMSEAWDDVIGTWATGTLPHVAVGSTISPDEADLTLTGSAPSRTLQIFRKPENGDLTLTGSIPGWNLGKEFDVAKGDITSSTSIPTAVETGQNQPDKADLTLTGNAPALTLQKLWYVPTQDLTLSSTAPDAPIGPSFEVGTADMEIVQTYNWNNYGGTWANAATTWNEDVFAPRAEETQHEGPDKADLTLTGQVPISKEDMRISPSKGDLTLSGQIPVATENTSIIPAKGDLTLSGAVPRLIYYYKITPAKVDVTITGSIPSAVEDSVGNIPKGDLALTGYAPPWGISHFRSPAKGSITGLSSATWDNYGGTWAESSDTWGVGTLSPTVGITYTFPIDEAETLTLDGYSPAKVKKDPTYLANIIVT